MMGRMDDRPRDRDEDARRLSVLNAEIEKVWPALSEGHVPTAFARLCDLLPEAAAVARRLDLQEEVDRFGAKLESARKVALVELETVAARAERAVEAMYEARGATGAYADAKDLFADAIGLAKRLGLSDDARKLEARLAEVKAAFRGQLG